MLDLTLHLDYVMNFGLDNYENISNINFVHLLTLFREKVRVVFAVIKNKRNKQI